MSSSPARGALVAASVAALVAGCGPATADTPDAGLPYDGEPFAADVVRFEAGEGAGFGAEGLPEIVTGPPKGGGDAQGSLDVISLGQAGVIELRLGVDVVDGEGVDLVVFENAFVGAGLVFFEPGEVAVSLDGQTWATFECDKGAPAPNGCAGFVPVYADDDESARVVDEAGGDGFDLADVGLQRARYVRVRDLADGVYGEAGKAGFDLDAVAVIHFE